MDTIVAISTPLGQGAISIIRMSGPSALLIASKIFTPINKGNFTNPKPRYAYLGKLSIDNIEDNVICIYFKSPFSYTGEDLIEFQCHGSNRLADLIIQKCLELGAVTASKGDFTKRAFLNGKVSLAQAEGIIDMINSESKSELNAAYKLMNGDFSKLISSLQNSLALIISEFEASFDYPDEYDGIIEKQFLSIESIKDKLEKIYSNSSCGQLIKNGLSIAIIGNPNAGKSSILNAILGYNKAIVTNIPGTTRDIVEGSIEINGFKLNFADTAGIRESGDEIEQIGIIKSKEAAETADLILFIKDAEDDLDDLSLLDNYKNKKIIKVINKIDKKNISNENYDISISALNSDDIKKLLNVIIDKSDLSSIDTSGFVLTSLRHKEALNKALISLNSALINKDNLTHDCIIMDLKDAYFYLGCISGNSANEDIITKIFENFCVGK